MKHQGLKMTIASVLAASVVLSGCTKTEVTPSQSGNPTPQVQKPVEISWLSFDFPEQDGSLVQNWIEKKFNVKIKNMRIDRQNWKDQLNLRLATNELPDMWLLWGTADVSTYSQQGLLAELPIEEIKKKMPTLAEFIDKNQPSAWNDGLINGKSYGIPITNLEGVLPLHPFYNGDWLKAIGYNQPPTTLKELEDVLYKFRNNDPDGNGKKDTFGLTGYGKTGAADSFQYVFGAHHVHPKSWSKDKSGNLVYGITTEGARESFKLLNKWFKDGVLDPEFITNDGKRNDFENKRVGISTENWSNFRENGKIGQLAKKNGINLMVGKALEGPYGPGKLAMWGLTGNYIGMSVDAGKNPAKKEKIYEILNSFYSDKDSYLMSQFGEDGVHYSMENGKPVIKDDFKDSKKRINMGFGNYYGLLSRKSKAFEPFTYSAEEIAQRDQLAQGVERVVNEAKFIIPSAVKYPDLVNIEQEYFIKFITGEVDTDKGFDRFVETWNKSGGKEITEEVNKIYKELSVKK
ncbi:extracellular solute-binding protein [Paenibacillus sp. 2RAB27]|uniref:extracellular solute-binding protein n=1 Tax=Paenibacillus sp. 2RAB27 TaxID=3232991 RepID=UPI003F9A393B